ncbi:unnamed protein product [Moneuplotes crassus]|uniref:histidine kinase n=1 Tax=Euplotes crassus TaxID=5936 RepID=A0AAD1UTS1_EUPCR|nr:unnamed protein product [Moneuplotes crassus]
MHLIPKGLKKHDWIINYSGIFISSAMYIQMTEVNLRFTTFRINEGYLVQLMVGYTFSTCVATNWKVCCMNQCLLHLYGWVRLKNRFGVLNDIYYLGTVYALVFFIFGSYCYSINLRDEFIANYNNNKTMKGQKEILNSLPEGVLIANKHNEYKYTNSKIKQTLNIKEFCRSKSVQDVVNLAQDRASERLEKIVKDLSSQDIRGHNKISLDSNLMLVDFLEKFTIECTSSKFLQDEQNLSNQLDESYQSDDQQFQNFDEYRRKKTLGQFLQNERKSMISGIHCSKESKINIKYELGEFEELLYQQHREFIVKTTTVDAAGSLGKDSSYIHMFVETTQISQLEEAKAQNHYQRQMLSNVSHEFRTPLNSIVASLELMRMQDLGHSNRLVRIASSSCSILGMLVEDILDHAKLESGVFQINEEVFTITECLHEIQEVFTLQADGKGLQLRIDIQDKLRELPIMSDKGRLKQVIMNLVSNALKFTDRGSITIEIREKQNEEESKHAEESKFSESGQFCNQEYFCDMKNIDKDGSLELPSETSNNIQSRHDFTDYCFRTNRSILASNAEQESKFEATIDITLKVIDTGIGISKVDQKSLFKLFGKLSSNHNRNKTGCGLGLTICKKIIEKLDGTISLHSEENIGTTVECHFTCKC